MLEGSCLAWVECVCLCMVVFNTLLCCVLLCIVVSNTYYVVFSCVWCCPTHIMLCLLVHGGVQHILCCVFLCMVVSNTYYVVFLFCFFFVFCTLCFQFLWIVHFRLQL